MKKILIAITVLLALTLSGCDYVMSDVPQAQIIVEEKDCDLIAIANDLINGYNGSYTFEIIDGVLYELKDGEYTGDTFTNEDLIEHYCEVE